MTVGLFTEGLHFLGVSFERMQQCKGYYSLKKGFDVCLDAEKERPENFLIQRYLHKFLDKFASSSSISGPQKTAFRQLHNSLLTSLLFSEDVNSKCVSEYV